MLALWVSFFFFFLFLLLFLSALLLLPACLLLGFCLVWQWMQRDGHKLYRLISISNSHGNNDSNRNSNSKLVSIAFSARSRQEAVASFTGGSRQEAVCSSHTRYGLPEPELEPEPTFQQRMQPEWESQCPRAADPLRKQQQPCGQVPTGGIRILWHRPPQASHTTSSGYAAAQPSAWSLCPSSRTKAAGES